MASQACRFDSNDMQMLVKKDAGQSFEASEKLRMGFANPAKLEVNLFASGAKPQLPLKVQTSALDPCKEVTSKGLLKLCFTGAHAVLSQHR